MLGYLAGVPGRLKTLTDRLTSTWAAKLDTLHDTRLTSARAGYIDNLANGTFPLRGYYTDARGTYLEKLNISGNVLDTSDPTVNPPTGLHAAIQDIVGTQIAVYGAAGNQASCTNTETNLVNLTGKGVLQSCLFVASEGSQADTARYRVYVDGNGIFDTGTVSLGSTYGTSHSILAFGSIAGTNLLHTDCIPFRTSLRITSIFNLANSGASNNWVYWRARRSP